MVLLQIQICPEIPIEIDSLENFPQHIYRSFQFQVRLIKNAIFKQLINVARESISEFVCAGGNA